MKTAVSHTQSPILVSNSYYFPQVGLCEAPSAAVTVKSELVCEILKVPISVRVVLSLSKILDLQSGVCCLNS